MSDLSLVREYTARGTDLMMNGGCECRGTVGSHLQTQRAAVKMLHDRIQLLIQYVSGVVDGASTLPTPIKIKLNLVPPSA